MLGVSGEVKFLVGFLIALLVGFEAGEPAALDLLAARWRNPGVVVGARLETAERRFFEFLDPARHAAGVGRGAAWDAHAAIPCPQVIGLFPEPERERMSVAIIDYGSGNLHSAAKAFERAARDTGERIVVTADPEAVANADRIVLPGVGAFADCRRGLDAVPGMVEALNEAVIRRGTPFLGICVGCQLMAERGLRESAPPRVSAGSPATSTEIEPSDPALKIPHMGWNTLDVAREHPLLSGIPTGERGSTPISCIRSMSSRASRTIWWRRRTTAGRSPQSSGATTMPARSSIPRRARRLGWR